MHVGLILISLEHPLGDCACVHGATWATATLGINNQVSKALGITVEMKITSQTTDFINQILSFLAYGGSSIVKTLNQTSFHMQWIVRFEVEVLASVGGFSVDFGGQCCLFPDDQNVQKRNCTI
jgi:hypothetical protein